MKSSKIILSGLGIALLGGVAYYGLSRKEIADRVIVKLSGMPRIHDYKDGQLFVAFDVTVINPSDSSFSISRPFVMCEFTDWLDQPAIANTEPSGETYLIAAQATKVIKDITIGLPVGISPNIIASFVGGLVPKLADSLQSFIKPLDLKLTIRFTVDYVFNIEIKDKYSFNIQEMGGMLRNLFTKKAPAPTAPKPSGVSGIYHGNYDFLFNYEL